MDQHRTNVRAPPSAPRCSESGCLVARAPAKLWRLHPGLKQAYGALSSALLDRAGASSNVALLVSAVACTGFRVHQHRTNEHTPPSAPCRTESGSFVAHAPAGLGMLHPGPTQAHGALRSALFDRASASSNVALIVTAVTCTGCCMHQHRTNERAPPSAPRCSESGCVVARASAKLGRLRAGPTQAHGALGGQLFLTVLALALTWRCSCPRLRVLGFACTNTEPTSVRHRQRHAALRAAVLMRAHLPK